MAVLLLITEQEIKDITSLNNNVPVGKFRHHIQTAQDVYIKPAIGETCYSELLDGVENDDLTPLEITLLDGDNRSFAGLKVALAWHVMYLAIPDFHINIGNAGVNKKTSDNFEPVSLEELSLKRESAKNAAASYTKYLIKYIQANSSDYACYVCDGLTDLIDDDDIGSGGVALDWHNVTTTSESQEIINREIDG